jgi:hypothetical protein
VFPSPCDFRNSCPACLLSLFPCLVSKPSLASPERLGIPVLRGSKFSNPAGNLLCLRLASFVGVLSFQRHLE